MTWLLVAISLQAWINEKACPELLPYQAKSVEVLRQKTQEQVCRLIRCWLTRVRA